LAFYALKLNIYPFLDGHYLGVSVIADTYNAEHIYDLIKMLKTVGSDSLKVSPSIVDNDGLKNNKYHKPVF